MSDHPVPPAGKNPAPVLTVFAVFLKLGLTSFGGPVAHLGYFNHEFVVRRKWLSAAAYAEIVALCQFLPGPASSQTGMMIGLSRAGLPGALAAWLGFTLPSAVLLAAFAFGAASFGTLGDTAWLHGLKIAAVAIVAQALIAMSRSLCPDVPRAAFAVLAAAVALLIPTAHGQLGAITLGGLLGGLILKPAAADDLPHLPTAAPKFVSLGALILFFTLLVALPLAAGSGDLFTRLFDSFYRAGALVFGGGHVVLPLLQREVIPPGLIDPQMFIAGYGAAQAVPGPLFTFAAFLGAAIAGGWGAVLCTLAIFLPSFLLIIGVLPFWSAIRRHAIARAALQGVNAAVVGLLAAAFAALILPAAISGAADAAIAVILLGLLVLLRAPSWLVVALGAAAASATAFL